jgi:hypothetical protein
MIHIIVKSNLWERHGARMKNDLRYLVEDYPILKNFNFEWVADDETRIDSDALSFEDFIAVENPLAEFEEYLMHYPTTKEYEKD